MFAGKISVADPDPFHFAQPDLDPGSKISAKIMKNVIIHFFLKNSKLMFKGHKYLPHKLQNDLIFLINIFLKEKKFLKGWCLTKRIRGFGSKSK